MADQSESVSAGTPEESEDALVKALFKSGKVTKAQIVKYVEIRERLNLKGKRYLGDILVERGHVSNKALDKFFSDNNSSYLKFCDQLKKRGFLTQEQHDQVINHKGSKVNVVSTMDNLGIMTKASFIQLYSKHSYSPKLGEWLISNKVVTRDKVDDALTEQNTSNIEDFLVYNKIMTKEDIHQFKEKHNLH